MTDAQDTAETIIRLERRLERERRARRESEHIAEGTLRDLYSSVVELKRASDLVNLLQRVAVAANEADTLEAAVTIALSAVCDFTGWPIGHLYVVDEPGHLQSTTVWHLVDRERAGPFVAVTEATSLSAGVGLPGRVLSSGQPAWIEDVRRDPNFPRARVAENIDVVAGFAFPILVGTEVVGVLEFFAHEEMQTDDQLLSTIANLGSQLGRVVERLRAESAQRRSEEWTREILETANDAFVSIDVTGRIIDWNRQAERHFGWPRSEAVGQLLTELIIPPVHRESHTRGIARYLATGEGPVIGRRVELEALHRDGHQFPIELTPWAVQTDDTVQFNAFIHDITQRKAFEQELQHQSLHDSLTGLPNRALLLDRLERALARAQRGGEQRVALLFFDLDRFKAVNDSFGHEAGDRVLLGVAERVPSALRSGDTLARLSGDEFVVLCEDVADHRAVEEVAIRILDALSTPFHVAGSEAHLSASIGIALTAGGDVSAEALLADADLAMYRAKERGRGVIELFDERLRIRVTERLTMERALRTAIERDELVAHYQPVVDVASGRVTGVEALARWSHPTRGLLSPESFIPLAEESALIGRIGEWMLNESCAQLRAWRAALLEPPAWVGVNLSVRELEQPGLVAVIERVVREHDLPPDALLLEITESAVMHDAKAVVRRLWELKEMGIRLAIDDFGTGFSSLDRLRRMPVGSLKIDRSFITEMSVTTGGTALVAAIIAMSHSLGLSVVAEGVESKAQLDELRRLGCDEVQGYLVARPAPAEGIEPLLRAGPVGVVCGLSDAHGPSSGESHEEMLRLIEQAMVPSREIGRTTGSLLAELQRLI